MAKQKSQWKPPKAVQDVHLKTLKDIGAKLEKLRGNMTALELAGKVRISRNSYRQMEKGEIYFSMENFLKILNYHGVNIKDFFSSDTDKS